MDDPSDPSENKLFGFRFWKVSYKVSLARWIRTNLGFCALYISLFSIACFAGWILYLFLMPEVPAISDAIFSVAIPIVWVARIGVIALPLGVMALVKKQQRWAGSVGVVVGLFWLHLLCGE